MQKFGLFLLLCGFGLEGALIVEDVPTAVIEARESQLHHPEGVAFTPSGDYLIIANYLGESISFHRKMGRAHYETIPSYTISGKQSRLCHPHDVSVSPDGAFLAIANREDNRVAIHHQGEDSPFFSKEPLYELQGEESLLNKPGGVAFAPNGKCLAVCNTESNTVTFYNQQDGFLEPTPYSVLSSPRNLVRPDGIAFSPSGEYLAVTSHGKHSLVIYRRSENSPDTYGPMPYKILKGRQTGLRFSHSVAFHPTGDYLAVTSAGGGDLSIFPCFSNTPLQTFPVYNPKTIHLQQIYQEEGGGKGIAFSPDGTCLVVCNPSIVGKEDCRVLIYAVREAEE